MPRQPLWRIAIFFLTLFATNARAENADLILYGGKVVTVDKDFSVRTALAVKDGKVLFVGTNEEVLKLRGPTTTVIDVAGKMVLPGSPANAPRTKLEDVNLDSPRVSPAGA